MLFFKIKMQCNAIEFTKKDFNSLLDAKTRDVWGDEVVPFVNQKKPFSLVSKKDSKFYLDKHQQCFQEK
jgi:hypothetical protein